MASLSCEDLIELNITAFGARKRLLLAIKQLKNVQVCESPSSSEWIKLSEYNDIPSLFTHLEMDHQIGRCFF